MKKTVLIVALLLCCSVAKAQVVLIHGFLVHADSMLTIRKVLERSCMSVNIWHYPSRKYTIECHAKNLNEYLKCLAAECPGEPIDFVTHSIGGVILRSALSQPDCPAEAKCGRAVLFAPPNRGSALAREFGHNPLVKTVLGKGIGRELTEYTPEQMLCVGSFPASMQVLVVAGCRGMHPFFNGRPNDGVLMVEETCLNTPHLHKTVPLRHSSLTDCEGSIRIARNFLLR